MSTVNNGPQIVKNSLVLGIDASTRGSYIPYSLINMSTWTVGTGGATGYNANGNPITENERFSSTNPWGNTGIIWGSFPSGNGNDDGGWNTDWFNIDNTKLYRFSVWVKRTSNTTGGTFYLGMYANGDGSRRMDNSAVEGNAYWTCISTSGLTQDVWYLYVGHVYPFNTSYTGRHPDTGYYFVNNPIKQGDVNGCNIGTGDLKWSSNSTQGIHRTYHYYCADSTTRLQWYDPRVDVINGKQPSITELVNRSPIQWRDLSGNNRNAILTNGPIFNTSNGGNILFDGVNDYAIMPSGGSYSEYTFMFFCKWITDTTNGSRILGCDAFGTYTIFTPSNVAFHYNQAAGTSTVLSSGVNVGLGTWCHVAVTVSTISAFAYIYINGTVRNGSNAIPYINLSGNLFLGAQNTGTTVLANCNISAFQLYNRVLTATEIMQNFQADKTRFGL